MIILFVCAVPTIVEAILDRHGETKLGKRKDLLWTVVAAIVITGGAWWLGYRPLPVIGLIIGWRILAFDYLVTYLLIKNDVISPNAKWWNYTGKTAKFDRLISRVNWKVRLIVRIALFVLALLLFLWQ